MALLMLTYNDLKCKDTRHAKSFDPSADLFRAPSFQASMFISIPKKSTQANTRTRTSISPESPLILKPNKVGISGVPIPKGPCTQIVYTLALKYSLYRYIGPKVYTVWVHGPLGYYRSRDAKCWPCFVFLGAEAAFMSLPGP